MFPLYVYMTKYDHFVCFLVKYFAYVTNGLDIYNMLHDMVLLPLSLVRRNGSSIAILRNNNSNDNNKKITQVVGCG